MKTPTFVLIATTAIILSSPVLAMESPIFVDDDNETSSVSHSQPTPQKPYTAEKIYLRFGVTFEDLKKQYKQERVKNTDDICATIIGNLLNDKGWNKLSLVEQEEVVNLIEPQRCKSVPLFMNIAERCETLPGDKAWDLIKKSLRNHTITHIIYSGALVPNDALLSEYELEKGFVVLPYPKEPPIQIDSSEDRRKKALSLISRQLFVIKSLDLPCDLNVLGYKDALEKIREKEVISKICKEFPNLIETYFSVLVYGSEILNPNGSKLFNEKLNKKNFFLNKLLEFLYPGVSEICYQLKESLELPICLGNLEKKVQDHLKTAYNPKIEIGKSVPSNLKDRSPYWDPEFSKQSLATIGVISENLRAALAKSPEELKSLGTYKDEIRRIIMKMAVEYNEACSYSDYIFPPSLSKPGDLNFSMALGHLELSKKRIGQNIPKDIKEAFQKIEKYLTEKK